MTDLSDLSIEPRFTTYQPENLTEALEFVGECNRRLPHFDNFHPGDIAHWMSSTFRGRNLSEHFGIVRDEDNKIVALNIISKVENPTFDLILHPRLRGLPIELALLKLSEKEILDRLEAANIKDRKPSTTLASNDSSRKLCLEEIGYQKDPDELERINARSLTEPIPEPALPPGFIIRSAAGEQDAVNLAKVHINAFNSKWAESSYLDVMRSPSYDAERELVVVAPDGTFAAFLVYWPDPVSRIGLFEPVGCHKDYQRQGLTKVLMYSGMQRMKAAGMQMAWVLCNNTNEAGKALYTSVGFHPVQEVYQYHAAK